MDGKRTRGVKTFVPLDACVNQMINVTQTYLPPFDEYTRILQRAWDAKWITNNGQLVRELEERLKDYLKVEHLLFTTNGTVVLQMALKALGKRGEIITTPFSYVATTNAILWEGCQPVFADVLPDTFCISPESIEQCITENTIAILATHVYGLACETDRIEKIAAKHGLTVIYDGAHAFGSLHQGRSLLSYGDISTCSFHATKLFHTVEGGCIIAKDEDTFQKLKHYRSFGHYGDEYFDIGINGKNSEFHAAMGLAVFPYIPHILERRKALSLRYRSLLAGLSLQFPDGMTAEEYNYAYFPVLFNNEAQMTRVKDALTQEQIHTRRYFFPSLNQLPVLETVQPCPISENASSRVLCLPLYPDLKESDQDRIVQILKSAL